MKRENIIKGLNILSTNPDLVIEEQRIVFAAIFELEKESEKLSRRDEIASKMMVAWRSNPESYHVSKEEIARYAINDADVLIAELDKEVNND